MFERKKSAGKIYALPIESIQPSPFQARTNFNEQELAGLAASIRENGLLQPIAVREKEKFSWRSPCFYHTMIHFTTLGRLAQIHLLL